MGEYGVNKIKGDEIRSLMRCLEVDKDKDWKVFVEELLVVLVRVVVA